jgi:ABC-type ATPase involved in cell division
MPVPGIEDRKTDHPDTGDHIQGIDRVLLLLPVNKCYYIHHFLPLGHEVMHLIELSDYTLARPENGNGIKTFNFSLSRGEVCSIHSDSFDDAHLLIQALATLVHPLQGEYRFQGQVIEFSDYRDVLFCKKKIGYIASGSAMLSNKTVRENLLLSRCYFENSLSLTLDENVLRLCRIFGIQNKLDLRSSEINQLDSRIAISIRELTKPLELLLLERPEDFIKHSQFGLFMQILKDVILSEVPVVFVSYNKNFVEKFSNKKILISGGTLKSVSKKRPRGQN